MLSIVQSFIIELVMSAFVAATRRRCRSECKSL